MAASCELWQCNSDSSSQFHCKDPSFDRFHMAMNGSSLGSSCSIDASIKSSLSSSSCITGATNNSNSGSMSGPGDTIGELTGKPGRSGDTIQYVHDGCGPQEMNATVDENDVDAESSKSSLSMSDDSDSSVFVGSTHKPHRAHDGKWEAIQLVQSKDGTIGLNHFRLLKRLGCGDIGSVYLSELRGTGCCFAMKVMDKGSLASRKKLLRAQTEREILQCLDHPFLPSLYTHFDTDKFTCLVMEFCPGGDLHTLRQRQPGKHFSEPAARFYAAEVLLALEYLHMMGIIYRDLKPENILVREDGHIMLSDFDLSLRCVVRPTLVKSALVVESDPSRRIPAYCVQPMCEVACITPACVAPACIPPSCLVPKLLTSLSLRKNRRKMKGDVAGSGQMSSLPELLAEPTGARSMSFVGTHEYLAPEIIKGEGHGSAVDWWTFGIFLYELLHGKTPFKGVGNRATLFNVVGQPLKFPDSPSVSYAARDLITGLLVKDPQQRLAYKRGAVEIRQHPFFEGVNWALIRSMAPPEVPRPFELSFLAAGKPTLGPILSSSSAAAPAEMPSSAGHANTMSSGQYLDFDFF
ncbi:hypothetical protein GOP47_0021526 [Adiantum capillus-veneris]|uniref:non-specific serine/threonine protein kinase n=1 Tax=Adiantum capillus-veneris TaxID=13818 RepID=A0A9D4Z6C5_ADICA|nr:hypothetical protein GOP47_0021526 [Adiantum capillus-veneris]